MEKNKLAIIIPAYKSAFLDATLKSIFSQTDNRFNLYIGDDASPNNLFSIVEPYLEYSNVFYYRFDSNLGGYDLVSHWNRCIELTNNEEWIWLFSDDDLMDSNCVEEFYYYIKENSEAQLLHFNVQIIDENDNNLKELLPFPEKCDNYFFFKSRLNYEIYSFAVEYVFKRELYIRKEKFQNFDLAWCADDATWIKFSSDSYINTIPRTIVKWRYSGSNISSIKSDYSIISRKILAGAAYINWVENQFRFNKISRLRKIKFIWGSVHGFKKISFFGLFKLNIRVLKLLGHHYFCNPFVLVYLLIVNVKCMI